MSFCTVCGRPRSAPAQYCTACGASFPEAVSSGAPAAEPSASAPPQPDTVSADRSGDVGAPGRAGAIAVQQTPGSAAEQDPFGDLFQPPSGGSHRTPERLGMVESDGGGAEPRNLHPVPRPGRRRKTVIAVLVAVAVLIAGGGVATWVTHRHHARLSASTSAQPAPSGTAQRATGSSSSPATPSASPGSGSEQAELTQIAAQVQQSVAARQTVVRATGAVGGCTMLPSAGISLMNQAVSQRQAVIDRFGSLPVNAISDGQAMLADLKQVLQHSITADQDFIGWMQDIQNAATCPVATSTDASYQAAFRESALAVTAKEKFLALWNPVASQFGQPTFTASEL